MVPAGLSAIREDVQTYLRVTGARSRGERLRVVLGARALWALMFYRWGRWIYVEQRGSAVLRRLSRLCHAALRGWVQRLTRVSLPVQAQLARDVWIGSHDTTRVNPAAIVGEGARLFGGNTLGVGGRGDQRGAPRLGANVVLGPGASAVGPVVLADEVTLGSNACAAKSISEPGIFVGVPATRATGHALRAIPLFEEVHMKTARNELSIRGGDVPLFGEEPEPFWAAYRQDLGRYTESTSLARRLWTVLTSEGLWALFAYRLGRWVHTRREVTFTAVGRFWLGACWVAYCCLEWWVALLVDIRLHVSAQLAPGLFIGHFKSIHVGAGVRIGRNCNIGQMCWIAAASQAFGPGAPVLGDRVYVGVGAKVIGPVKVGDDVAIGASAVVLEDVPDRAVVVGNPSRVINHKGSGDFISLKADAEPVRVVAASIQEAPRAEL